MVVYVFVVRTQPRNHDRSVTELDCGDDGTHSGVAHDYVRLLDIPAHLRERDKREGCKAVVVTCRSRAQLSDNLINLRQGRYEIECAKKRLVMRAQGNEDQRTLPLNSALLCFTASSGH